MEAPVTIGIQVNRNAQAGDIEWIVFRGDKCKEWKRWFVGQEALGQVERIVARGQG